MTNIRKVSALAGVSIATVSRTLKSPEQVTPATRDKVMKAIKEAKYRPNWLATSVKTGKSKSIVVLVPNLQNSFFLRVVIGIENAAQEKGYTVLLADTQGDSMRENDYASMVLTSRADGLIQLDHSFPFSDTDAELAEPIPMVSVGERVDGDLKYPFVQLDNYAAGRALAHHLVNYGHTRIGAIAGQRESQIFVDRLAGFKSVLNEEGIDFPDQFLVGDEYSYNGGINGVKELMGLKKTPTAIFCFNDDIAIGGMHQLFTAGYRVPEDVSVVGFDNVRVSPVVNPSLTTIDQPAYDMGAKAVDMLYSMMQGETMARTREVMPFELKERGSSGPVKID